MALLYFELEPVMRLVGDRAAERFSDADAWEAIGAEIGRGTDEVEDIELLAMEDGGNVALLRLSAPNSLLIMQYTLQKVSLALQQSIRARFGKAPKIMSVSAVDREQFRRQYVTVRQAYDYAFFLPERSVFLLEQVPAAAETPSLSPLPVLSAVLMRNAEESLLPQL